MSVCLLSGQGALAGAGARRRGGGKDDAARGRAAAKVTAAKASAPGVMRFLRVEAPQTETAGEGQSATLMPDGRWLLVGGRGADGLSHDALLKDAQTGATQRVAGRLAQARAWHTATLLADGTVLVLGGTDADGNVLDSAELFRPETGQFEPLPTGGLAPRAHHTATLLTDGDVLVAGGTSRGGRPHAGVELWGHRTRSARPVAGRLQSPRGRHHATLQPDGSVLLWGGQSAEGASLDDGELYEPESGRLSWVGVFTKFEDENAPYLRASLPPDGSTGVPVDGLISLRFSKPLRVTSVTPQTVSLKGPQGVVAARVVAAEGGMLAFVLPDERLLEATTYTITLSDAADAGGRSFSYAMLSFTTEGGDAADPSGEDWIPDARNMRGDWRSNRPESPWQKMPPLRAAPGVTALAGQVLLLNGNPLAGVTLQVGTRTALTDQTGRFLLTDLAPGRHVMRLDGRSASKPRKVYGVFKIGVDVEAGQTNVLPYTSWMPRIDTEHAAALSVPTSGEVAVTSPYIPGLEVRVPQGSVVRDIDGQTSNQLSITPIPVDRTPFPLPPGVAVPVFFTVQPGAAKVIPPRARVIYPNYGNDRPGTRMNFWNYDPAEKGWYVYGQGTVTPDGRQVVPDAGVVLYEFTGFMINRNGMPPPPGSGPEPGSNDSEGDPVDLSTGLFVYEKSDLVLPDALPILLTRTYRQNDSASRAFGVGTSHPYDLYLYSAQEYVEADLVLPDGGRVHYVRISPGTGFTDAEFEHTTSASAFYKSRLKWNGNGWDLKLKDGTTYVFGDEAPLHTIRDRFGNKISISRSGSNGFGSPTGPITRMTTSSGRWMEFTYDASNRVTQAKDNIGRVVNYTYDASGRLWKVTDPNAGVTEFGYDASHRMTTIKDPRLLTYLTNLYDANGRVSKQTQADGSTFLFAYTTGADGRITQTDVTDERGSTRRIVFNADGFTVSDTRALGKPEQQTVTHERQVGTNLPLSMTDAAGRKTAYTYDSVGNVASATRLAGTAAASTMTFTYEPAFNNVATVTDPLNHTTRFAYDTKGSLLSVTDPLNHATRFTYTASGLPATITDALDNKITFTYDAGDLISVTDQLGRTVSYFRDDVGRVLSETDPLGAVTRYDYDPLNQLTKVTDQLGNVTTFTYDPNGNLLTVTDARGGKITYTYNNMDRLSNRTDQLARAESYVYDLGGNLTRQTDRRGKVTTFTYDAHGRPTFVGFGTVTGTKSTTYESTITNTYDASDRLTRAVDSAGGTITRTYDDQARTITETTPQGSITYAYDAAGRMTSKAVPGQPLTTYAHDDADRLLTITQGASVVAFGYDNADRRTSVTLPNGVVMEYGFDAAAQLTGINYRQNGSLVGDLGYGYNMAGRRTQARGSFARLAVPQAVATTTHNAGNQLTRFGAQTLTYDANGNLTGDGTNTYTWNARNQLASVSGGVAASFTYDAFGRRVSKTVGGATTSYLYDGVDAVQEQSGGAATANMLVGGIDEVFLRTDSSGARSLLTDGLGSTLSLLDSTGAARTQYTYEPFGKTTVSGAASSNPSKFTGREDDGTGLYFYRGRYYSPALHRFVSEDPIGLAGGINFYAYVGNNPITRIDPYGLDWLENLSNFSAGFGDTISFGLTEKVREWMGTNDVVDKCSGWYTGGQVAGVAHSMALGGGIRQAAALRGPARGLEWSHWIPRRYSTRGVPGLGGRRLPTWITEAGWNGKYVSGLDHALNDPFRYRFLPRALKDQHPINPALLRQWNRMPNWLQGGAAGGAYGGASMAAGRSCGC